MVQINNLDYSDLLIYAHRSINQILKLLDDEVLSQEQREISIAIEYMKDCKRNLINAENILALLRKI